MFILANWWEFSAEQNSQNILKHSLAENPQANESHVFQQQNHAQNYISWQEFSAKPESSLTTTEGIEASFIGELKCDVGDATKSASWLYIVHTDIPDDIVDEYNEWYDKEHLPRLVTVPAVLRARRFVCEGQCPKYLTAYSLDDPGAFESPAGLIARKTPWTARMRSLFFNTRRTMAKKYDFL